jgi:phytoene/squalene synthetase
LIKRELQEFLDIRNKLVHEARFLRPDKRRGKHADIVHANYEQYFMVVMGFVGRLMLAILGYDGTCYSWILDYSNKEPTLSLKGRKMPYLSGKTS